MGSQKNLSRRFSLRLGMVALASLGFLQGCASVTPGQWAALSNSYNESMRYDYEQLNKYRQGPVPMRQPTAAPVTVERCSTWPYCPQ